MGRLFEERERAEELYFVRSQEAQFLAHCRAIRRLADFATGKLGLDGATARTYGDELIGCLAFGMKDDAIVARVRKDLAENGIEVSQAELNAELTRYLAVASPPAEGTGAVLRPPRPLDR